MRDAARRAIAVTAALLAAVSLTGCRGIPQPEDGAADRTEQVDGCRVSLWVQSMERGTTTAEIELARKALLDASVSPEEQQQWEETIRDTAEDSDHIAIERPEVSAFVIAVRLDVRRALNVAGYVEEERAVDVYSAVECP